MGLTRTMTQSGHSGLEQEILLGRGTACEDRLSDLCRFRPKSTVLFIDLLRALRKRYCHAKIITLIVDNYIIHKSKKAQRWLEKKPKFRLLFLPVYSPWHNTIELLWYSLHETITAVNRWMKGWNGLSILWIPHHHSLVADTGPSGCSINRNSYLVKNGVTLFF